MTFHQMNIFRCLVLTQSFKAASEAMYVSQPSISIQIKNFENELGVTLIDRKQTSSKGVVVLTEEGKAIYGSVCMILDQCNVITRICNKTQENYKHTLNILTNSSISTYVLPNVLHKYSEVNPDVIVKLTIETDADQLCKLSNSSAYDICIIPREKNAIINNVVSMFRSPIKLVTATNAVNTGQKVILLKSGKELPFSRILLPSHNSGARKVIENYFEEQKIELQGQMEIGQAETTKRLLFKGTSYCAFLSSITTKSEIESGLLQEIKTDPALPFVEYAVVANKSAYKNKQNKAFVQCLNNITEMYKD